jgi:hypothetical protein
MFDLEKKMETIINSILPSITNIYNQQTWQSSKTV